METERLQLTPIGPHCADELYRSHQDPGIARWYGDWTRADAEARAAEISLADLSCARELGATEAVAFTEAHNTRSRAVIAYRHDFPHRGEPFALYEISLDT